MHLINTNLQLRLILNDKSFIDILRSFELKKKKYHKYFNQFSIIPTLFLIMLIIIIVFIALFSFASCTWDNDAVLFKRLLYLIEWSLRIKCVEKN